MIYLDNNSTTQTAPAVLAAMQPFLNEFYGNPSSSHSFGRIARLALENAREQVAATLGARNTSEIVFTSGGTESTNWAFLSALKNFPAKKRIVTTKVEHEVVARNCEKLQNYGYEIISIDVDAYGLLDLDALSQSINENTALVSVMQANNETGVLFPVARIGEIVKEQSSALFHVDGAQSVGKIPINLSSTEIDLFSISGHKFHAPKGVGALYVRDGLRLSPFLLGGGQERNQRAGTENVASIIGLGTACELVKNLDSQVKVRGLRDLLENEILKKIPDTRVNGTTVSGLRLPNTTNISFAGIEGETILAHLDAQEIYVSTGSACNSETHTASSVLSAMNISYHDAMGAIRFSLSRKSSAAEITFVLSVLPEIVEKLREISPLK
ncbi:MAG: aminotransferase class V-fold PLP-dependent enzyme [Pyrinomonadaceae bacterium]